MNYTCQSDPTATSWDIRTESFKTSQGQLEKLPSGSYRLIRLTDFERRDTDSRSKVTNLLFELFPEALEFVFIDRYGKRAPAISRTF